MTRYFKNSEIKYRIKGGPVKNQTCCLKNETGQTKLRGGGKKWLKHGNKPVCCLLCHHDGISIDILILNLNKLEYSNVLRAAKAIL